MTNLEEAWNFEFDSWKERMGGTPTKLVRHWVSNSEYYDIDRIHLFEIRENLYAVVSEYGCSCYEPSDASIDTFGDITSAEYAFELSVKERMGSPDHDDGHCKECGA